MKNINTGASFLWLLSILRKRKKKTEWRYKVINACYLPEFECDVSEHLNDGWMLVGSAVKKKDCWMQTVVKKVPAGL